MFYYLFGYRNGGLSIIIHPRRQNKADIKSSLLYGSPKMKCAKIPILINNIYQTGEMKKIETTSDKLINYKA